MDIYVSVQDKGKKKQLVIDGPLEMLEQLLKELVKCDKPEPPPPDPAQEVNPA